jgi:transcriptional regulator GlxA family with amidase domain
LDSVSSYSARNFAAYFASDIATTERTLTRKFKETLAVTPMKYVQNLRINTAKYLLETSDFSLDRIIEQVGYQDRSGFSKLFHRPVCRQ